MGSKFSARLEASCIHGQYPNLRFISGKWFNDGMEIKNPQRFFMQSDYSLTSAEEVKRTMDVFIMLNGEDGDWLELPIIADARNKKELDPLCFPLTEEQLVIINRLLVGGDDEVMFICTGIGGSGKSTFLNIVKRIFDNDVGACTLSDLSGFQLAEAIKHRLIASDELNADELDNGALKTLVSRQSVQANPKNQTPYQVKTQSALFFCCNNPPKVDLSDTGLLRRIVYYKMDKKIENPDTSLQKRDWSYNDLVNIVAHALRVDITNWRKRFDDDTHHYLLKDNSVWRFREQADTYNDYVSLCNQARLKPYSEPKYQALCQLIDEWYPDKETEEHYMDRMYVEAMCDGFENIVRLYNGKNTEDQLLSLVTDFSRRIKNGKLQKTETRVPDSR